MSQCKQRSWTVRELINALVELDLQGYGSNLIIMSRDDGNGYSPMYGLETIMFKDGDTGLAELTPDAIKQGFTEEDVMTDGEPAVLLWPHG